MFNFKLNIQFFGRGRSKGGGGGNGGQQANPKQATPSGITYDDFMKMSDDQKYDVMNNIINDTSIQVPVHLDNSVTSKVLYGLGMDNKPNVVTDAQLNTMNGQEIFRTVYESGTMPPPSSSDVLDQIRHGDYTQLSGSGGSLHGRAIYFANDFAKSAVYGKNEKNPMVMRGKINSNANIANEASMLTSMRNDSAWQQSALRNSLTGGRGFADQIALYAISKGYDGWTNSRYTMMINRGAMTVSSQNKGIATSNGYLAKSWRGANNAP